MGEDISDSLRTYKIHLDQVQAALRTDPNNAELLKLQSDLEEVITLSEQLVVASVSANTSQDDEDDSTSGTHDEGRLHWKVSDECLAQWSEDKQWYKATIDAITNDGMVAVSFDQYNTSDVTELASLRPLSESDKLLGSQAGASNSSRKRRMAESQRQQQKKKKQKKFDRQKQIEEAHEIDKQKWQQFTSKCKKLKGITKKSIFASPDSVNGRVGIGTCGIGGRPMTDFTLADKRRKGT